MLQAFYWDVPVDADARNGVWWDHLRNEVGAWRTVGITGVWAPSPAKGQFGIYDMGYGLYDPFDLGSYEQKGSVETRFGSRAELEAFLAAAHAAGIEVYADIVLNHVYTGEEDLEDNPAVAGYIDAGAVVLGEEREVYPTADVVWAVSTTPGAVVELEVGGYRLPWAAFDGERAFRIEVVSGATPPAPTSDPSWHLDADGGVTEIPAGGVHAIIEDVADTDHFSAVATGDELRVRLRSRRIGDNGPEGASPLHGYRVVAATVDGAPAAVRALTQTRVATVSHTGPGELPVQWTWSHFHPSGPTDWLEGPGDDEVRPRWRVFGQDLDTFHPDVAATYQAWGAWLTGTVGFDGVRLDWVVGVPEGYVRDFLLALGPAPGGGPRFSVGEFFTPRKDRIRDWVAAVDPSDTLGARLFDFPLKFALTDLANEPGESFDIRALDTAGMIRDGTTPLPPHRVVTFVENHDTGKEHGYWIERDHDLAHAFLLFAEGRPCLFYKHLYALPLVDIHDPAQTVTPAASLPGDLALLAAVRAFHLGGELVALSAVGDPFPADDAADVWVGRRAGAPGTTGAVLVLNDHETEEKGLWVSTAPPGAGASWAGRELVEVSGHLGGSTSVYADGRAYFAAPPRSFTVWVPADEWDASVVPTFPGGGLLPGDPLP